jgi:heme exporter protein D
MNGSEFNWADFFHMGGYAVFVWSSYGLALVMVVVSVVSPIMQRKKIVARIKRAIKREAMQKQ